MKETPNSGRMDINRTRRQVVKTVGASTVAFGVTAGAVRGEEPIGTLATAEPQSQNDWETIDYTRDEDDDGTYEGHLELDAIRWKGSPAGSSMVIPIDQESSAATNRMSDDTLIDHIDHSIVSIGWDSSEPGTVNNSSPNDYNVGKYYGSFVQNDDYSFVEAVLETAHDNFLDWLGSTLAAPIYGPATFAAEVYEKVDGSSSGSTYIEREWNWTYKENSSCWSQYLAYVDNNEWFEFTFSHLMYLFGMKNLFADLTVQIHGSELSSFEIDRMSATEAQQRDIDVYDLEAVEENPRAYGIPPDFLKDYDGDYLYKVPVEARVVDKGNTPSDDFIDRHQKSIKKNAPELLD